MSIKTMYNSKIGYQSLVADKKLSSGYKFWYFTEFQISDIPSMYTIQIGENKHLNDEGKIRYMNHSCNPNAIIDAESMSAMLIRPVEKGEEITFFYPSTEWDMAAPFLCNCGSDHCVGEIRGAKYLSKAIFDRYFMNSHIIRLRESDELIPEEQPISLMT